MRLNSKHSITRFYLKFLNAIFITNDLNELLVTAKELGIDYTSVELLKMLRDLIIPYTQNNSLPEHVSQNLYSYLNICRFEVRDNDTEERIALCNELIKYLNVSKVNMPYPFYESMINSYSANFFERLKYHSLYESEPKIVIDILISAIELEYVILYYHSEIVESDEFVGTASVDLVLSLDYLLATAHLLREHPELLFDKLYLSRLSFVLENNELLLQAHKGVPDEACIFELSPGDEDVLQDKKFWKLHRKIKKMVLKAQKDS